MRGLSSELETHVEIPPLSSVPLVSGAQSVFACSVCAVSVKSSVNCSREAASPPQLAMLVGCISSLSCVEWVPLVGCGGPSSSTDLNCRAAIPTLHLVGVNEYVLELALLPECCSAVS